jgi:hypothetical protein
VLLDDVELRKPVELRGNPAGYTAVPIKHVTKQVLQRELSFSGYIVIQEGKQLRPADLRGTLVRIRDVGVGLYDASMLDYRINEGPRSRWLTSEVFVESGLEDALNIDRDSFNRYSAEFQVLQRELHSVLQKAVFPEVYRQIDKRTRAHQKKTARARLKSLQSVLDQTLQDRSVQVKLKPPSSTNTLQDGVSVSMKGQKVQIELSEEGLLETAKPYRTLAASILAIYDVSQEERDGERRRSRFLTLLRDLLRSW